MNSLSNEPRLGIDIGRVIIRAGEPGTAADTSFLTGDTSDALKTPAEPGALDTIALLVKAFGDGNVWLVSKCGHRIQERSKFWLDRQDFYVVTGVRRTHLRFCRKRHEKAPIAQELGLTHFIDDRQDCLEPMRGIVEHRFLYGHQKHEPRDNVCRTLTWDAVRLKVLATLGVETEP